MVGIMNAIQQLSLKIQMGIDPSSDISPESLRAMWRKDCDFKYDSGWIARREKVLADKTKHTTTMRRMR